MINLKEYFYENTLKFNKRLYLPKKYLAAFLKMHLGEKSGSIYQRFVKIFESNCTYRNNYNLFVNKTFNLGEHDRLMSLKDNRFEGVYLSQTYPFNDSLKNGIEIIKSILKVDDIEEIDDRCLRNLINLSYDKVENGIYGSSLNMNCGINQNVFDFIVARDYLLEKETKNPKDLAQVFYSLVVYSDIICELIDNVKKDKRDLCLNQIKKFVNLNFDPRYDLADIEDIKLLSISELFFCFGTNVEMVINLINYYSEDVNKVIPTIFLNYLKTLNPEDAEVIRRREEETLNDIGNSRGLTRERIRQIEKREIEAFEEFYNQNFTFFNKNLIFVFPENRSVFSLDEFKTVLKDDNNTLRNFFKSIKLRGSSKYVKSLDAIVENNWTYEYFETVVNEILGDYFRVIDKNDKIDECLNSLSYLGFNSQILETYIDNEYLIKKSAYVKKGIKFCRLFQVETLLKKYFENGIHFSDKEQIEELNKHAIEEFGERIFTDDEMTGAFHNVQAIIARCDTRLIDRGTYIHSSKTIDLPMDLVERIIGYLNRKERAVAYSNLYETFEVELNALGLTNKYALQGAMSIYEGELFKGKRDFVTPVVLETTLRESIINWIKSQNQIFTYGDFENEFKGVANSVFMTSIYEAGNIIYFWRQGYIDIEKVNITLDEKNKIKQILDYLITVSGVNYVNADKLFDSVKKQIPELISKTNMQYSYDLFSYVECAFANQYKIKRPVIGLIDCEFKTCNEITDSYLMPRNVVNLNKLRNYLNSNNAYGLNDYKSIYDIIIEKHNEFIAIDSNTIVRKQNINISEKEIFKLNVILETLLTQKESIELQTDVVEKSYITEIAGLKVNKYLIFGVVNTYLNDKYDIKLESHNYRNGTFILRKF